MSQSSSNAANWTDITRINVVRNVGVADGGASLDEGMDESWSVIGGVKYPPGHSGSKADE